MAQTGYTPILIYSSTTASQAPAAGNLTNSTLGSELAINITDGKLFYKDNANAVQVIAWKVTPTTAGGTGLTSYAAGDTLYYTSGTVLSKLSIGSSGYYMSSTGTAPQWSAPGALTKTDDTNVTLTLGGSASTALLNAASLTLGWTGQLAVTRGGTGLSTVAQGDILYGSAADTLSVLAKNTTATRYLSNTGTSNNPAWAQIDLTNGVTGALPTANGGTGLSGASPFTANGILYASSASALATSSAFTYNGTTLNAGSGKSIVVGSTNAPYSGAFSYTPQIQTHSGDTNSNGFGVFAFTSGGVARMQMNRSKSTTIGTNSALASGDSIGAFSYNGADGTGYAEAVRVSGFVDGTVSTGIVPGRFMVYTMNTSGTVVEAYRVSANQFVGINTAATAARRLEVKQDGAPGLRITNTTGGAGQGIELLTASTRLSWLLGAQYNVSDAFEITPSTAAGGTTFTTPSCVFIPSAIYPGADNTSSCGLSGNRWSVVYAATGTINTSDARKKTNVSAMTSAEINAAKQLAQEIGTFKFLDAIEKKGEDKARIHCGMTVQRAIEIMESNGLSAFDYAFICYDKWDDVYKDFLINEGEKIKVSKQVQKTQLVKKKQPTIEIKDGVAVLIEQEVEVMEGVVQSMPVVDENGQPVFDEITDEQGNVTRQQKIFDAPVMQEIEVEVDAEPKYESRLTQKGGDAYGFRPDELAMFVMRGLAESMNQAK